MAMETEMQRSAQHWERLRRAAERKEFEAAKAGLWDRVEHGAGGDLETRKPLMRGWPWLKAVSMVVFSRPTYKQIEPPSQPAKSGSDNSLAADEATAQANCPQSQPRTTAQVHSLISPQDPSKFRSNNPVPQIVMDVSSNHPQSTETAQVQALLSPRHTARFVSNNTVHDAVMDVPSNLPRSTETTQVVAVHVPTVVDKMKKEQQGRCLKYSQKVLGFAVCTFIGYASAISLSTKGNTTFRLAIAPFFVAICADLFSLKTKAKHGNALVYLSSLHLVLMIYLIFISFNRYYAYAILFLPLVAGASFLQQKTWPEGQQQSTHEKLSKDLDNIFDLSALVLNWSTFITAIMAIFRDLIKGPNAFIDFSVVGLFFFLTMVLGLYLMLVTTVRTAALNLKYLDVLLICLLVGTLISALITFMAKTEHGSGG